MASGTNTLATFSDTPATFAAAVQSEGADLTFAAGVDATRVNCLTTGLYAAMQLATWATLADDKDIRESYIIFTPSGGEAAFDPIGWASTSAFIYPPTGTVTPQYPLVTSSSATWRAEAGSSWQIGLRNGDSAHTADVSIILSIYRIA